MLDVTLLGTGGTMPMKQRWLTSLLVRAEGKGVMIDCGEGTQIALHCAGCSVQHTEVLCFTHYHADHISGLPGLLLSMGLEGRTEPLRLVGPVGLRRIVEGLRVIAPELPYPLLFQELTGPVEEFTAAGLQITAFSVCHTLPCYGYRLNLPRAGKFDPDRARTANIPLRAWGMLQKQKEVTIDGRTYRQEQVLGAPRRGLTVTYCTDTRPTPALTKFAENADLLICEGMYGDAEKLPKARETKHMMIREAAETARDAGASRLWLTHYSPAMPDPQPYLSDAQAIFPETVCGRDGMKIDLRYVD